MISRMTPEQPEATPAVLRRELGVFGATMMGLGSIIGTGIFVSIGIAVGVAGPSVVLAIAIAAVLAICNALSSAQLAASHPTSGGTYEYGYVYLTPRLGFSAGWMFLCAKSASAATAALGFAGYTFVAFGFPDSGWRVALALAAVCVLVVLVLNGLRRSSITNIAIVSVTLIALTGFVLAGLPAALRNGGEHFAPFLASPNGDHRAPAFRLLEASALMFVAYTGYGRIATMGEEVRDPRRTIPRAIIATLLISMTLYMGVGIVGVGAAGVSEFGAAGSERAAPLAVVARGFGVLGISVLLAIGAVTAMLGVLLNLILGLSRVALAMGRRGDLPKRFAQVHSRGSTPVPAVLLVGAIIACLTAIGSIKLAWSFSAFTVLVYYAITNLAAIRLPGEQRLYPRWIAWVGLLGCLSLAFWVEPRAWIAGLGLLFAGLAGRGLFRSRSHSGSSIDG